MSARSLLSAALIRKSAVATCAAAPETNAPAAPSGIDQPKTFASGEFHAATKEAPSNKKGGKKTAGVVEWLCKTAGIPKTAARRPGRLDGDDALDKLAKLHSKRKKSS